MPTLPLLEKQWVATKTFGCYSKSHPPWHSSLSPRELYGLPSLFFTPTLIHTYMHTQYFNLDSVAFYPYLLFFSLFCASIFFFLFLLPFPPSFILWQILLHVHPIQQIPEKTNS